MTDVNNNTLVYVVEDSHSSGALYCRQLEKAGFTTQHFFDGYSALAAIKKSMPAVIVQDVNLPDISGLEVLQFVRKQSKSAQVVIITSNSSIDIAVEAMRLGGFDFIEKPFSAARLVAAVINANKQTIKDLVTTCHKTEMASLPKQDFIGESLAMQTVFRLLISASRSKASVFITGESGTGKEVCAQTLHNAGARRQEPFIAINCAAIPAELFESEFFGHVRGAFSGALTERKGAVEVANGGTLFLDEICEMEFALQAKLLRFLQTGTFCKVGSNELQQSDVRIVCATNRNPSAEVGEGRFREDLYYRLNVIPIKLPPLRERTNDILLLAKHFLQSKSAENSKAFQQLSPEVEQFFLNYDWPGNIRELQNTIENIVVMHDGIVVSPSMLPSDFGHVQHAPLNNAPTNNIKKSPSYAASSHHDIVPLWIVEKNTILSAIACCDGNIPLAAAYLGVSASTIYRKIKSWEQTDN